jgi:S-DNA-T family DNA segregation ATPase FtsK/SpoIIIE
VAPSATRAKQTIAPPPQKPGFFRTLLEDPDAFSHLLGRLPRWLDEVLALLLIALGAVIFASLLNSGGSGELSGVVAENLRQAFGDGAFLVAGVVAILGLGLLLPKIGLSFQMSLGRLIALELVFVAIQGLLHGLRFESEGLALARQGGGGGYMGWGINQGMLSIVGEPGNIILLSLMLVFGLHWLSGLRRQHYRQALAWFSQETRQLATKLESPPPSPVVAAPSNRSGHVSLPVPPAEPGPVFEVPPLPPSQIEAILPSHAAISPAGLNLAPAPMMPAAAPVLEAAVSTTPAPLPMTARRANAASLGGEMPRPKINAGRLAPPPEPLSTPNTSSPSLAAAAEIRENNPGDLESEALEPLLADPLPQERPSLVINGRAIDPGHLRERPSIVPRQASTSPRPAAMAQYTPKEFHGGRDENPNKRYFRIADFEERKKAGKRYEVLPDLSLLHSYELYKPDEEEVNTNASIIENSLLEFDLDADVIDVKVGPVVTQYAVSPIKQVVNPKTGEIEVNRIRVDKITSLQGDLSLALSAKTLRIEAPVPGHSYVGIEVPNRHPSLVGLRSVMESEKFYNKRNNLLCIPLGRDVSGEAVLMQLAGLPHLLVAGTTGSGKSVFLTALVTSLIMNNTPEEIKLILLDPKRVELTRFNGLPHLLGPVETEADQIIEVLRWLAREMDKRYKLMEAENARNIQAYNESLGRRRKSEHLPYMVMVFDEIGDLMMSHPDETEGTITRLAQKARAAGIHLVIATQRPSTDIVTGLIKANFPGRLSFAVASGIDSRVILDYTGAETLLGKGDMLFLAPDAAGPQRVQGCFVSDEEVEAVVRYWKEWYDMQVLEGKLERPKTPPWERGVTRLQSLSEQDVLLEQAIAIVCEAKEASTSMIQRRLGVGYPRAAHLMDMLHELGVIGPPKAGGQPRSVLISNYRVAVQKLKKRS